MKGTLSVVLLASAGATAQAVVLFEEDFESVTLGPIVTFGDSDNGGELPSREAWSATGPAGWTTDNSGVPGDPINDGVREFRGWTFVDDDWWTATAGDQNRSQWTRGYGAVAVADNDEFDDFSLGSGEGRGPSPDGCSAGADCFEAFVTTPTFSLQGAEENTARLVFDSSWRPEDQQDASLEVSFDGGPFQTLFTWNSVNADGSEPVLGPDGSGSGQGTFTKVSDANGVQIGDLLADNTQVDEVIDIALNNPAGANTAQVRWGMLEGGNDWWWAIDNIQAYTGTPGPRDPALKVVVDQATGNVSIVNGTSQPVDLSGYQLLSTDGNFDASAADFLSESDPANWVRLTSGEAASDLSEGRVGSQPLASGATINLGDAWADFYVADGSVGFSYLVGGETVRGLVEFVGDTPAFLDLNFDGSVDILDWTTFLDITDTADLSDLTTAQAYRKGDLDGDLRLSIGDFVTFEREFNRVNGAGAFATAVAKLAVPEPTTVVATLGLLSILSVVHRR